MSYRDYSKIRYKRFVLTPYFDITYGEYGCEILDTKSRASKHDPINGADSLDDATEWAKALCDDIRQHQSECITIL